MFWKTLRQRHFTDRRRLTVWLWSQRNAEKWELLPFVSVLRWVLWRDLVTISNFGWIRRRGSKCRKRFKTGDCNLTVSLRVMSDMKVRYIVCGMGRSRWTSFTGRWKKWKKRTRIGTICCSAIRLANPTRCRHPEERTGLTTISRWDILINRVLSYKNKGSVLVSWRTWDSSFQNACGQRSTWLPVLIGPIVPRWIWTSTLTRHPGPYRLIMKMVLTISTGRSLPRI